MLNTVSGYMDVLDIFGCFFSIFLVLNKDDFQASPRHAAEPWSSSGTAFWGHHPSGRTAHVDFSGVDTLAAWARVSGLSLCYGEILTTRSYKHHDQHACWTTIAKSCCWWVIFKRNLFVITFTWPDLIDALNLEVYCGQSWPKAFLRIVEAARRWALIQGVAV